MDRYEYRVIMLRIQEIEQEQLHVLEYACKYLDCYIDVQRKNVQDRMLQLREEKAKLNSYINSSL